MPLAPWAPLTAFTVSLVLVWQLSRGPLAQLALDRPNERSLHNIPVPRSGGLGLHAGILLAWLIANAGIGTVVLGSLFTLLAVSALDDVRGLPILLRLATHVLTCCAVAFSLLLEPFGLAVAIACALGLVWMTNLYNFMDGADGLAGGMGLFGFGCYGIAAWLAGSAGFAWLNFSIAAAAFAFLLFNFHPARIFLGDAGSIPLGFLAGCLGLHGWLIGNWPWWFPLLVFSPFIVDATVTITRRACAGAAIWRAHRDHYYQRLVQMGWGHRKTAFAEYVLMLVSGGLALLGLSWVPTAQSVLIIAIGTGYLVLIVLIEHAWRKAHVGLER